MPGDRWLSSGVLAACAVALIREGFPPPESDLASTLEPTSPWAARPLAEEVRDVQATRRRLAASEASEHAGVTIEELLQRTAAETADTVSGDDGPGVQATA